MQVLANAQQYISMLIAKAYTSRNGVKNNHPVYSQNTVIIIIIIFARTVKIIEPSKQPACPHLHCAVGLIHVTLQSM